MAYLESVLNKSCDAANLERWRKTWFILKRQEYRSYDRGKNYQKTRNDIMFDTYQNTLKQYRNCHNTAENNYMN